MTRTHLVLKLHLNLVGYAYSAQRQLFGGGSNRGAFGGGGSNFGGAGGSNFGGGGGGGGNKYKWTSNDYQRQQGGKQVTALASPNDIV